MKERKKERKVRRKIEKGLNRKMSLASNSISEVKIESIQN